MNPVCLDWQRCKAPKDLQLLFRDRTERSYVTEAVLARIGRDGVVYHPSYRQDIILFGVDEHADLIVVNSTLMPSPPYCCVYKASNVFIIVLPMEEVNRSGYNNASGQIEVRERRWKLKLTSRDTC